MAKESGELSSWRGMFSRMGEEVAALRQTYQTDDQELASRLSAYHENASVQLPEDQRRFVCALAEHDRLVLLPEIAALFCELTLREGPAADSGSNAKTPSFDRFTVRDRDTASVPKAIHLVDVPAAIESIDHLTQKICGTWGSREFEVFLNNLSSGSRDGDRNDFSIGVVSELIFLSDLNRMIRAIDLAAACSISIEEAYQHLEDEDQQLRGVDVWGDPVAAPGVIQPIAKGQAPLRDTGEPESHSELLEFIDLMVKLATNKIAIGLIVIILAAKLILR